MNFRDTSKKQHVHLARLAFKILTSPPALKGFGHLATVSHSIDIEKSHTVKIITTPFKGFICDVNSQRTRV